MGYFEISSKRDQDSEPLVSRVSISDADIDRIAAAQAQIHFAGGVMVDGGDRLAEPPVLPTVRPPTGQEVFDAFANDVLQDLLTSTVNIERTNAAKKAQEEISPIELSAE